MSGVIIGRVASLRRYPVKSMLGEEIAESALTPRGLAGDRAYGLIDVETGKLVSAKRPRLWTKLFEWQAEFDAPPGAGELPPVRITLSDGTSVKTSDPPAEEVLSAALGRRVTIASSAPAGTVLEEEWPRYKGPVAYGQVVEGDPQGDALIDSPTGYAAPGTFFDFSAVHILTTGALARLQQLYPEGQIDARRFRPNIIVETEGLPGFIENGWPGRRIAIGDVRLQVLIPTMRCVMTTLPQAGGIQADAGVLKALVQHNRVDIPAVGPLPCIGAYASVLQPGVARTGDAVVLE